ncbi:autotransporter domain-containing protein [Luteibacter sp. CQ10]|uniref:autotransporter domain-containing protein n=1 Tax=Luteibacter sp. CQ10 TaxID=2805821 RepID=UPI0034A0FF37
MNRTYRLVWNRALRVVQVASELSSSPASPSPGGRSSASRLSPFGLALAACGLLAMASPSWAQVCAQCGATGGAATSDRAASGGQGNGQGGAAQNIVGTHVEIAGGSSSGGSGGSGATGIDVSGSTGPSGGAGGGTGTSINDVLTGGQGADGAFDIHVPSGGGGGGAGIYSVGSPFNTRDGIVVIGGAGGAGGVPDAAAGGAGGGGGGASVILAAGGNGGVTVGASSSLIGGAGGHGGQSATASPTWGGGGGGGGDGVLVLGINASVNVSDRTSLIRGGVGGAGGVGIGADSGLDGNSGAGIRALGTGLSVLNFGTIQGGDATGSGQAGAAIVTQSNAVITNGGTLSGGVVNGDYASSVVFNGGGGVLTLSTGSAVNGAVELAPGATATIVPAVSSAIDGATLDGGGASLSLNLAQALDMGRAITGTGNVTSSGTGDLYLRGLDLDGNANFNASGEVLAMTGPMQTTGSQHYAAPVLVAGDTNFISGASSVTFDGTLDTTGGSHSITVNAPVGAVTFRNMIGPGSLPSLTVAADSLAIGAINASALTLAITGDITQASAFSVTGTSRFISGGDVILTSAGNAFGGAVNLQGRNVAVATSGNLAVNAIDVGGAGNVALSAAGTLTFASPVSTTGDIALSGRLTSAQLSGHDVTLNAIGGLTLNDDVAASGLLSLGSTANVDQLAGAIQANTLTATTGGSLTLGSAGNAIATVGDVNASGFSLADSVPVTFAGNVQVGTFELAASQGATLTGSIVASTVATLDAGTVLSVGNGGTSGSLTADLIDHGTLVFNRADTASFTEALAGDGSLVKQGAGKLLFDGDGSPFQGQTHVEAGELVVGSSAGSNAKLAGPVDVAAGASLGGHGRILGNVSLDTGATLSPGNSIGTLSITGNLALAQGTTMTAELGASGVGDSVAVDGDLFINGTTVDVVDAGGLGPGVYNLFSYTGALSVANGGLVFGSTPAGHALQLVTLTGDKRIDIVDATNVALNYWNANGAAGPTQMGGGSGTWTTTSPVWTDAQGSITAAMSPQPGFAVFGGAPGTVFVNGVNGAVTATGMQFLSDGYRVMGDALGLVASGGPVTIRVGNGNESGSGYVATIDATLTGTQGFTKADAGTLVLNGNNLYSGDTTISGGHLQVSDDANLGSAANGVVLQGGTLRVTGTGYTATDRDLSVLLDGGVEISDPRNAFTWSGNVSGSGTLHKLGVGTLVFDHANAFTGPLIVESGTLRVGDNGAIGPGALTVRDGATFEAGTDGLAFDNAVALGGHATVAVNGDDTLTLNGDLADDTVPGTLVKTGTGTLALTARGTYTGGTEVEAGTLSLADGGAAGTGTVALDDGSTLALAQHGMVVANALTVSGSATVDVDDEATLTGDIADGALDGSLTKTGAGMLTLTGNAAYSGITTIADGTLRVGDGGTRGTLPSTIVNHGELVLDRSDDVGYAGSMSGDGTFRKLGTGVLRLTGDSAAFTGASFIEGGTLQLDGSLGGSLALAEGSMLTGTGAAGSVTFADGAELSPGGAGAIGALAFHGDLAMASGSRYVVDVNDAGQGDRVTVGGQAHLGGGSVVSLGTGGNWRANTTYTILSAAGGVDGRFADVSNDLAFLEPSLGYTANTVDLTLSRNVTAFPDVAVTRNQRATAAGVESLGEGVPVYDAILVMDAPGARHAFDAFSGEIHANLRGAIADDDRYQRDAIRQHLLARDDAGAWASAWGHWGDHDGDGNASRLRANGSGVMVGADTAVGGDTRIGIALGTGHVSASAGRDDAQGDTRTAAIYGGGEYGNVSLQAGALYSHRDIDTHRTVDVDMITGRLDGSQRARSAQAYVEGAYAFRFDRGSVDPFLNVARQQLRTSALHEHGNAAALDVMGEKSAQTFATVGVRGRWDLSAQGDVGLFGSVGWQHAWGDTNALSRQRFAAGGDAFTVAGTPIADDAGVATFGLRFRPWASVTVDAAYAGQFASHAKDQSARLSVAWVF